MTLCVRWIYEDDLELQSEIPKYCDHGYCHGKRGPTMSCDRCGNATRPLAENNGEGRIRFAGWFDLGAVETVCDTYKRYAQRPPVAS